MRKVFLACCLVVWLSPGIYQAQAEDPFASTPQAQVRMVPMGQRAENVPAHQAQKPSKSVLAQEASLVLKGDSNAKRYYWILALIGGIMVLFFLWKKQRSKVLMIMLSAYGVCGPLYSLQAAVPTSVTAFLSSPLAGDYYSRNTESSFNQIMIRGGIVRDDTKEGLFTIGNPIAIRVMLNDGSNEIINLNVNDLVVSPDNIQFEIPMNTAQIEGDKSATFTLQLAYTERIYSLPLLSTDSTPALIHIDSMSPGLNVTFPQGESNPQNTPVAVEVTCSDNGAGCTGGTGNPVTSILNVSGNFCDDEEVCNTYGVRTIRMCDKVENCTEAEITVDWYDPIPPYFHGVMFEGDIREGLRFSRTHVDREWHIDGINDQDMAADGEYDLQLFIEDGDGILKPHIVQNGTVVLPDNWSSQEDEPDLSDPGTDPTTYAGTGLLCESEGTDMIWCSVKPGDPLRNCCLLNLNEEVAHKLEPHICSQEGSALSLVGDHCMALNQPCLNPSGEQGRYDESGYCALWSCPFGFEKGRSHFWQNSDQCYPNSDLASWNMVCGACTDGEQLCESVCELPNGIIVDDAVCNLKIQPPDEVTDC